MFNTIYNHENQNNNNNRHLIKAIIHQHTQGRLFGIIGVPVVNVLEVNLSLNQEQK